MKLSMKWLEVFQAIARGGSMREAARRLDLSVSTVSHQLASLESAIGVSLVDHGKRPLRLTAEGEILLRRVDHALDLLRQGVTDVWSQDPGALVRTLRIALVEDLDADVAPGLAAQLAADLPSCSLSFLSRPSHDILTLLQSDDIDIGIASASEFRAIRLREVPLLRDPYVLVAPGSRSESAADYLAGRVALPFLRYSKKQVMGRRIEAQLGRLRLNIPARFEFESTAAILGIVARGEGWTVTTALTLTCMDDLRDHLAVMPFPDAGFARQLSAFRSEALPDLLFDCFLRRVRPLLCDAVLAPAIGRSPWLEGGFRLLDA